MLKLARLPAVVLSSMVILIALPAGASAETCPNAEYRVGPSAALPDCRAYEQVTPVEKLGGLFYKRSIGVDPAGEPDIVSSSFTAINGIENNAGIEGAVYAVTRTTSGWVSTPLPPPASEYETSEVAGGLEDYLAGSLDGRSALYQGRRFGQPANRVDFWVTHADGSIEDIGPITPPSTPSGKVVNLTNAGELDIVVRGVSADLSHIIYGSRPNFADHFLFWPFDETLEQEGSEDLYEFVGHDDPSPILVGVDETGKLISDCGTVIGGNPRDYGSGVGRLAAHNAVSYDGDTVSFTALACGSSPPVNELFARVDNGEPGAHTVAISEPSREDCASCNTSVESLQPAIFQGASRDGSKVFFLTRQPLLGGDASLNIYEYDFSAPAGERVVHVSGGDGTVPDPKAEVEGVVQTSEDGSHVYFVARGVLTTTPNNDGQVAREGANNLYLFERDVQYPAGRTVFIADLSSADTGLWLEGRGGNESNVTPDGGFLVFTSTTEDLTPDDTSTARQVFEYDAQTGDLVRVSIGQDGYGDNGNTDTADASIAAPNYSESSEPSSYLSRLSISADGAFVFFESADGLTPQALNDQQIRVEEDGTPVYANNIYEYHDGNVYLISDGRDLSELAGESDVYLLGTDESGDDVFFTTADALAPSDIDTDIDIYDARIDGGFPAPPVRLSCSGDECQGPLSPAPVLLSPGSEFQAGDTSTPQAQSTAVDRQAPIKKKQKHRKTAKRKRKSGKAAKKKRVGASRRVVAKHRSSQMIGGRS